MNFFSFLSKKDLIGVVTACTLLLFCLLLVIFIPGAKWVFLALLAVVEIVSVIALIKNWNKKDDNDLMEILKQMGLDNDKLQK